jgi:hypothetical protein
MGIWSDWYSKNAGKENSFVNVEFVLKQLDKLLENSDLITSTGKALYPVGSIYISTTNTSPANWIQGTVWIAWGSGRVPVGVDTSQTEFDTAEKTGGSKNVTVNTPNGGSGTSGGTAITINQMPNHNHMIISRGSSNASDGGVSRKSGSSGYDTENYTNATGGGQAHSHSTPSHAHPDEQISVLQPYITCYIWKRII